MGNILPPPQTSIAPVQKRRGSEGTFDFTPIWRDWFIKLAEIINKSGGVEGAIPATREITTTAPLTGGGPLTANIELGVTPFDATHSGVVPAAGGDPTATLHANGTWVPTATGLSLTVVTAKLTGSGNEGSMTFVDGLLVAQTQAT